MFDFLISAIGILASIFALSSTVPQIIKGVKTKKMDDVSVWLILSLIVGLSLWVIYGIGISDVVIVGGNSVGVSLNVVLLFLKFRYSRNPIS
ncbi:MAG TPA: SemiSWEET family transporter [Nitrososphaeraceae archaeon]|jgi:MtN3 and saliva related transmembrane protein|nr:SemiSWEET family transporter [Nitrososphaeraceae archaeon]